MTRWLILLAVFINTIFISTVFSPLANASVDDAAFERSAASEPQQHPHIEVQLVSELSHWQPNETNWVAVVLRHEHHWHTYWANPGESGLPTRIKWTLPEGVSAGDIQWPVPKRIEAAGIINIGFEDDTLLMVRLTGSPADNSGAVRIQADVSWLVCKEACIPGDASLKMSVPLIVSGENDGNIPLKTEFAQAFTDTRSLVPQQHSFIATSAVTETEIQLQLAATDLEQSQLDLQQVLKSDLFAEQESLVQASATPSWQVSGKTHSEETLIATLPLNDYFLELPDTTHWVMITPQNQKIRFSAESGAIVSPTIDPGALSGSGEQLTAPPTQASTTPLLLLMAMALVGGLLLNLMPCVFPVLAIKAVSLVKLRGKEKQEARKHGWLYLAGIQASLLLLSGLLLALKLSGQQLGWGFQLQDPWFLAVLATLMFAMGLALFGVFELGARFMSLGQEQVNQGGYKASFLSGVLAVVVASPCMTPLMAPAVGAALTLPAIEMVAIMLSLGFGLALPFWAISMVPKLAALLPKPGAWLETFKQAMAFPLLLTSVWLLWLLSNHQILAVIATLLVWVIAAFVIWLQRRQLRRTLVVTTVILVASLISYFVVMPSQRSELALPEQVYSQELLQQKLSDAQPVLVNMTADWCLTCKVNERVTFADSDVKQAFNELGVSYLVGDWTHQDAAITQYLDKFQHAGVPLYVIYDTQGNSQVLPQLLTPALLIDSLQKAVEVKSISATASE
ncbi:protein-disulfide reductase DsbD family protein [Corallincola platygyrae]|uniref:Protein-disulfide reductase DsbD family protein n=1 Tax=Corallincola platygyrae TaxID=1193278 RepID=A0ABW4XHT6_9GAMM